jgi:hypothetical protein
MSIVFDYKQQSEQGLHISYFIFHSIPRVVVVRECAENNNSNEAKKAGHCISEKYNHGERRYKKIIFAICYWSTFIFHASPFASDSSEKRDERNSIMLDESLLSLFLAHQLFSINLVLINLLSIRNSFEWKKESGEWNEFHNRDAARLSRRKGCGLSPWREKEEIVWARPKKN